MQVERSSFGWLRGERLRNTWVTCPGVGDTPSKDGIIPHTLYGGKLIRALREGPAAHQVVGVVTAHQATDGYPV
jgi:hypothetical protein